jgi:hypothetical protein
MSAPSAAMAPPPASFDPGFDPGFRPFQKKGGSRRGLRGKKRSLR